MATAVPKTTNRRRALLLIGLFVLIGVAYSLVTPPFETPDEPFHYAFARHIAQGNGLPVQDVDVTGPWAQEGSQAPLYYVLTGLLTAGIDQNDFPALAERNPRANIGDPLNPGNKNFMLYSGRWRPLAGANLALHLGRWFSLVLGVITLWFTYLTAELAFPNRGDLPLLVMAFVAAIPQFGYISASFSNDSAVVAASSVTLYWLARLVSRPDDEEVIWGEWIVLGVLLGLAALSKLQGLGLVPLSGLVVLFLAWRRRSWRLLRRALVGAGLPALGIAGWWFLRNVMLYGDWSGLGHLMAINGRRGDELSLADLWPEFRGLRYSFWGLFGWFNILLPGWFYWVMDGLTVVGTIGAVGAISQRWRRAARSRASESGLRVLLLLGLWAALMVALLLYWTLQATGSQGRLLFPGLAAFAALLVAGLDFWLQWLPRVGRQLMWSGLFALLLGMSAYTVSRLLPASYYAPAPVAAAPAGAQPVDITFGDEASLRLAAIEVDQSTRYRPGMTVPVTLYLQAQRPLHEDYQLFIQLLDETGGVIANLTTHPGWGRNPTTLWEPGALYADRYAVPITGPVDAWAPVLARVYVGFVDPATEEQSNLPLVARDASGTEITPFVSTVAVSPLRTPELAADTLSPAGVEFGNAIRLAGVDAPEQLSVGTTDALTVTLLWEALDTPAVDYTAYVHLVDESGTQVGGYDRSPAGDRFPTRVWAAGDRILSRVPVALPEELPPGRYEIWAGLYESASSGALRLPVTNAAGLPAAHDQVRLGIVEIE